jgi:hypothetical protein
MGAQIKPLALPFLRRLMGLMGGLVALHAGLTVISAVYWSKRTWGLVSGPGFYGLLLPLFAWALYQRFQLRRQTAVPPPAERHRVSGRRPSR